MRNSNPALLVLLLTATAVVGALALNWASASPRGWTEDDWSIGLAIAQVQLAAAATVLLRQRLWLRIISLASCITFWSIALALAASWNSHLQVVFAWQLVAAALVTAAWCGGLYFFGWQVDMANVGEVEVATNSRQFSLATLLFSMTIVAGYLGGAKVSGFTAPDIADLMLVLLVALAGCTAFTSTAGGRHVLPFGLFVVTCCIATKWLSIDTIAWSAEVTSLWRIALAHLALLGSAMFVLHMTGMRLARTEQRSSTRSAVNAHYSDQSAAY